MSIFLYQIPVKFQDAYSSGAVDLFGAILKDTTTGQIVGHVQETKAMAGLLNGVMAPVNSVSSNLTPLGSVAGMVQNHRDT